MRRPDPMATGAGFSDTADGSSKIRRAGLSDHPTPYRMSEPGVVQVNGHPEDTAPANDLPTPGDLSAALYGPPVRVAPYTAEPALSPAEIRRRQHEREVRQAARRLEAAVDAELRRRAER